MMILLAPMVVEAVRVKDQSIRNANINLGMIPKRERRIDASTKRRKAGKKRNGKGMVIPHLMMVTMMGQRLEEASLRVRRSKCTLIKQRMI